MVFDGVDWDSPMDGSALSAHPHAALTSEAVAMALVNGYYAGRRNGRLFSMQSFPNNERDTSASAPDQWITSLTPTLIGGGRGWVDGTWTHAYAIVIVEAVVSMDVSLRLRVVAHDGAVTATGATAERAVSANATSASLRSPVTVEVPYEETLVAMTAEVSLATLTRSQRLRITAQGCAAALLVPGWYRPRYVAIYLEARG